jgi:hypothetical protein
MKRTFTLLAASLLAAAIFAAPSFAQGNSGNAPGHGGDSPGNSGNAPGHSASGQGQTRGQSGVMMQAPGLMKAAEAKADRTTTAAIGATNFGTLISTIRAGKSSLDGVDESTALNIVPAETLIRGENRVALDNAIRDNQAEIDALRDELAGLDLELTEEEIDAAVAARVEPDGSLTIYTE